MIVLNEVPSHKKIRRCILDYLYQMFQEYPYADIELKRIEEECCDNPKEINWNMVYLEKCGYVTLGKSIESPPYIACSASLTALGIDLVENQEAYDSRFPPLPSPADSADSSA